MLEANTRHERKDGREYTFAVPSPTTYPFQWFWDSCFHAIVWAHFDTERAKEELRSLLAWQRDDGFIPHVIFWDRRRALTKTWHWLESERWLGVPALPVRWGKPATSALMQPPVIAQAVERVYEASGDRDFVVEVLPALAAYYGWLTSARDPGGGGLISIVAPFESGLDFSPAFDCALARTDPEPLLRCVFSAG